MMKYETRGLFDGVAALLIMMNSVVLAADNSVLVPFPGGAVGNATAADVVKGKSFSSRAVGRGVKGTLELPPNAQSYTNSIGMTFNLIPAGTFTMGSPAMEPDRDSGETQHEVTLTKSFYMQTTEVTQKQWLEIFSINPSTSTIGDEYPVDSTNWYEALAFANSLSDSEGLYACYGRNCTGTVGIDFTCTSITIDSSCCGLDCRWKQFPG